MDHAVTAQRTCLAAAILSLAAPALAGTIIELQPTSGDPLPGLTQAQLDRFTAGRTVYNTTLTAEQGLGPIFNDTSCASCHNNPIGGPGSKSVVRFFMIDDKKGTFDPLDELGGSLLQEQAIDDAVLEMVPRGAESSMRITNGMMGYGLVEAIEDADIIANQMAQPGSVQGVVHMVELLEDPRGPLRVGRFGWKAQVATIRTFSIDAALNEMGITTPQLPNENAPNGDEVLLAMWDNVADPEDNTALGNGDTFINRVTDFQRFLAQPPQTPPSGMTGEVIFNNIGCADCHTPSWTTSNDMGLEDALRNKTIRPYSDFLLHDMGLGGDPVEQGGALQRFVKTPPLWGLVTRDPMWHDGRVGAGTFADRIRSTAPGMEGVMYWHDQPLSQAQSSAQAFFALSIADQDAVIAFLASLGQAAFDRDLDFDVDSDDLFDFVASYTGSAPGTFTPDDPRSIHDADHDGDVDDDDLAALTTVFEGMNEDCNGNGLLDLFEILNGDVVDDNNNDIPDACEMVGDFNGDGCVNQSDLGILLAAFNQNDGGDTDGDGDTDQSDLGTLLSNFNSGPDC